LQCVVDAPYCCLGLLPNLYQKIWAMNNSTLQSNYAKHYT
jgi:hypothetical protein